MMTDDDLLFGTPAIYMAVVTFAYEAGDTELLRLLTQRHALYHGIRRIKATLARHKRELEAL